MLKKNSGGGLHSPITSTYLCEQVVRSKRWVAVKVWIEISGYRAVRKLWDFLFISHYIYVSDCYKWVFIFTCCLLQNLMPTSPYFGSSYQEGQHWFPRKCCHHLLSTNIIPKTFEIWLVNISVLTSLNCCFVTNPF